MALPSETVQHAVARTTHSALLRFFACTLSFGYVSAIEQATLWVVFLLVEPGERSAAPWMSTIPRGSTWMAFACAIVFVGVLARAGLLAFAIHQRLRPLALPILTLVVGIVGIVFEGGAIGGNVAMMAVTSNRGGYEDLAVMGMVMASSQQFALLIDWTVRIVIIGILFALAIRPDPPGDRDGPYREPGV